MNDIKPAAHKSATAGRENKPHIGIFGRCNSGKSTLLNFIVQADTAIVSPECGTTTDVVRKGYEILGFAPVIFIDTAGVDDASQLGSLRVRRTLETIPQIDLALLVYTEWGDAEEALAGMFDRAAVPYIPVYNRMDNGAHTSPIATIEVDAQAGTQAERDALLDEIKRRLPKGSYRTPSMFEGIASEGDHVLLVCPIDSEAPAGRLILPQVQAIRDLLDRGAIATVVQPAQIAAALSAVPRPKIVVTDSQLFPEVRAAVPADIELTSFSILLAGAKGDLKLYTEGLAKVDSLRDGNRILIAENCSHQVSCEDIGRSKIPAWLESHTGKKLEFTIISGLAPLPSDLASYAMMVQCGGCMVTRSQLRNRIRQAEAAGVPVTNYGMLIRKIRGVK